MNKIRRILLFVLFVFLPFNYVNDVEAHSGRTDSYGGHNCNVGSCAGTYHYHNSGYTPSVARYTPTPQFPTNINATWTWKSNLNRAYDVQMKLDDTNPTQYSAVISKCRGCNPGPLVDFYTNKFNFSNVSPGVWYVNVKKKIFGNWSTTVYWTIDVPAWVSPTPTPTPTRAITTTIDTSSSSGDGLVFLGLMMLIVIGYGAISLLYKGFLRFKKYARDNDWIYTVLFWTVIIGGIIIYSLISKEPERPTTTTNPRYTCDCLKTCPNMSCKEAYFQLDECGCSKRDGDDDGIPCEAQCK